MRFRVENQWAYLKEGKSGDQRVVDRATSFLDPGRFFSKFYRGNGGTWDGRVTFFSRSRNRIPAGLLPLVKESTDKRGYLLHIDDETKYIDVDPESIRDDDLWGITLHPYQLETVKTCIEKRRGILDLATGSGKTEIMAGICKTLAIEHNLPTLVLVPRSTLLHQTKRRIESRLGGGISMGLIGDGYKNIGHITIALPQTLRQGVRDKNGVIKNVVFNNYLRSQVKCIIFDEGHHGGADTWYDIGMECAAPYRYVCTGSVPEHALKAQYRIKALSGDILKTIDVRWLYENGYAAQPYIHMVTDPSICDARYWRKKKLREKVTPKSALQDINGYYIHDVRYHQNVALLAERLMDLGPAPWISTGGSKVLANELAAVFRKKGLAHKVLTGDVSTKVRDEEIARYTTRKDFCVIFNTIFDEGVDVPDIRFMILCGGGKSETATLQRPGRGIRRGGDDRVDIYDLVYMDNEYSRDHALGRLGMYEKVGYPLVRRADWVSLLADPLNHEDTDNAES